MDNAVPHMKRLPPGQQQVYRARFSAISAPEVMAAMVSAGDVLPVQTVTSMLDGGSAVCCQRLRY